MMRTKPAAALMMSFALLASACGGAGDDAEDAAVPGSVVPLAGDDAVDGVTAAGSPTESDTASGDGVVAAPLQVTAGSDGSADAAPAADGADDQGSTSTTTAGEASSSTAASGPSTTAGALRVSTTEPGAGSTTSSTAPSSQSSSGQTTAAPGSTTTVRPSTTARPTTTQRQSTTARPATTTTTRATTTVRPSGGGYFRTLPVGAALPSGAECAAQVKARPEVRAGNASFNSTRGNGTNDRYPRVDGNFTGTTDEIIQWAACKWGIDEDWARAQSVKESWWVMTTGGDLTDDQSACHPSKRTQSGSCPESVGLLQVRFLHHGEAFENANAIRSTAYNADYTYAVWRACFEGELTWLNDVERGRDYGAGDLEGCLGVWFSGRWYVPGAVDYIAGVREHKNNRTWESPDFLGHG